jgi:hypothetical protein
LPDACEGDACGFTFRPTGCRSLFDASPSIDPPSEPVEGERTLILLSSKGSAGGRFVRTRCLSHRQLVATLHRRLSTSAVAFTAVTGSLAACGRATIGR